MHLKAGVPQGSVLGPLLFLVYINDLTDNISSDMQLFADDSSLFTRVKDIDLTNDQLINDLHTISLWANQWKMVFNPNLTKHAIEVVFSCKRVIPDHTELEFNGVPIARKPYTKHLGVYLDSRLTFFQAYKGTSVKSFEGIVTFKFFI